MSEFRRFISAVLFTEKCASCGKTVSVFNKDGFCEKCKSEISYFQNPVFENAKGDVLISPAAYTYSWRRAVLNFKFGADRRTGDVIAETLASVIKENADVKTFDGVLYVPVYSLKDGRKYNQSEYLAKKTASLIGLPTYSYLKKKKDIKSQTACKNAAERMENAAGAYGVAREYKKAVVGKSFIVIDDVETTGATLFECGKALYACGAENVLYASAARTVVSPGSTLRILRPGNGEFGYLTFKKRWKKPDDFEKAARARIMKNRIFEAMKKTV